jgi:hypothetical protein
MPSARMLVMMNGNPQAELKHALFVVKEMESSAWL